MRSAVIVLALAVVAGAGDYSSLIGQVEKEYAQKQKEYNEMARSARYQWEFVEIPRLPWCRDDVIKVSQGDAVWIPGYGPIIQAAQEGVYIAVQSWIEKKSDRSQVTRLFLYTKLDGSWQKAKTCEIVENWDETVGWVCQR